MWVLVLWVLVLWVFVLGVLILGILWVSIGASIVRAFPIPVRCLIACFCRLVAAPTAVASVVMPTAVAIELMHQNNAITTAATA